MDKQDYTAAILVSQAPKAVFNAINNVRGWWSENIEGGTDQLNDVFFYHYKDIHLCKIKLIEVVPDKKVVWHVLDNHFSFIDDKSEWKDTKVVFDISTEGDQTKLEFTHEGLVPEYECYQICFEAWSNYINKSLYNLIAIGKGEPNPKEGEGFNSQIVEKWRLEELKFPIGPFLKKENYSTEEIGDFIKEIEAAQELYTELTGKLSEADLEKAYRPGSWNIRQLVHHVADIQMLFFLRMKRALTEQNENETTVILMDGWADTADGKFAPIMDSLQMLEGITKRYCYLMRALSPEQLQKRYYHPVRKYYISQAEAIAMNAWHLRHHYAHIQLALNSSKM